MTCKTNNQYKSNVKQLTTKQKVIVTSDCILCNKMLSCNRYRHKYTLMMQHDSNKLN